MQKLLLISVLFFFTGCIDESSLKPIIPYHVLHANSSKVWILNKRIVDGEDLAPKLRERKRTLTFFDDLQLIDQELLHLGSNNGLIASYSMIVDENKKDTILNIFYTNHNRKLKFKIKEIGYKTLVLHPITNDSIIEEWRLIPLNKSN